MEACDIAHYWSRIALASGYQVLCYLSATFAHTSIDHQHRARQDKSNILPVIKKNSRISLDFMRL